MEPVIWRIIAWTPLLQVLVLALGTLLSFLIAIFKKDVSIYLPFISENGAIIPEMGIFSTTLIFGSFIGAFTVYYRYLVMAYMLQDQEENNSKLKQFNLLTCLCGIGSMAGLAGVAAFPMSTVLVVHLIVAGIHFSLAMAYLFMNTYLSYRLKSCSRPIMIIRLSLCFSLSVFLFLLVVCMPFGYFKWKNSYPDKPHALKTPEDEGFGLLFASAWFEWSLYFCLLGYILTFLSEFRKYELVLNIQPIEKKEDFEPKLSN